MFSIIDPSTSTMMTAFARAVTQYNIVYLHINENWLKIRWIGIREPIFGYCC